MGCNNSTNGPIQRLGLNPADVIRSSADLKDKDLDSLIRKTEEAIGIIQRHPEKAPEIRNTHKEIFLLAPSTSSSNIQDTLATILNLLKEQHVRVQKAHIPNLRDTHPLPAARGGEGPLPARAPSPKQTSLEAEDDDLDSLASEDSGSSVQTVYVQPSISEPEVSSSLIEMLSPEQRAVQSILSQPHPDKKQLNALLFQCIAENELELVEQLIKNGAEVNAPQILNGPAPLDEALRLKNLPMIRLLVNQGALINKEGADKLTPLCRVIQMGDPDFLQQFLSLPSLNVHQRNGFGDTPLSYVIHLGEIYATSAEAINTAQRMIQALLLAHADPNKTNADGTTPLTRAISQGRFPMVQFLVETCHANPAQEDDSHMTPLRLAEKKADFISAEYLLQNGCDITSLGEKAIGILVFILTQQKNIPLALNLLERLATSEAGRALITRPDVQGKTLLEYAYDLALHGESPNILIMLLNRGVNPLTINSQGRNLLHKVIKDNRPDLALFILNGIFAERLAALNVPDFKKKTLLDHVYKAALKNQDWKPVFEELLNKGAKPTKELLMRMMREGAPQYAQELIEKFGISL